MSIYWCSALCIQSLFLGGGIIDENYRDNVRIILANLPERVTEIETWGRIAYLLFVRKEESEFEEVAMFDKTERGTKVFGSSGK